MTSGLPAAGDEDLRVLVVDDEPDLRLLMRVALERAGYDVEEADGGSAALERLREADAPEIVILDLRMPPPDGWEVLEALRDESRLNGLLVIAVSAHASLGTMQQALDAGCVAYLKKPFRVEELRKVLREVRER